LISNTVTEIVLINVPMADRRYRNPFVFIGS